MRFLRLRVFVGAATVAASSLVGIGAATPAQALLAADCGVACPVGTVSGTAVFPPPGTPGTFTMNLTGSAVSMRNLLAGSATQVPITAQVSGHWFEGCGGAGNPTVQAILQAIGPVVGPVLGPVLVALNAGAGCGGAVINGSSMGMTFIGSPSVGFVAFGTGAGGEIVVLVLIGNPSRYQGLIVDVNPSQIGTL